MSEKILSKELKEKLIELKEETETTKREGTKRFLKIWTKFTFIEILIYLVLKYILGFNLPIIPTVIGFLSAYIIMLPIMIFIKVKTGSIMGIDYLKYAKEKVMLDIEADLCIAYVEISDMLINEDKFMPVESFFEAESRKERFNNFLEYISSKEYIDFKVELMLKSSNVAKLLTSKEDKFKDKMQELQFIENLTEKELNKMSL